MERRPRACTVGPRDDGQNQLVVWTSLVPLGRRLVGDLRRAALLLGAGWRAGLGAQTAAADAALQQGWFAVYNLTAGCLGVLGAAMAFVLANRWGGQRMHRWLMIASVAACAGLLLRGILGLTLLGVSLFRGTLDQETPALLLAIEPWFVLGGLAYAGMSLSQRSGSDTGTMSH